MCEPFHVLGVLVCYSSCKSLRLFSPIFLHHVVNLPRNNRWLADPVIVRVTSSTSQCYAQWFPHFIFTVPRKGYVRLETHSNDREPWEKGGCEFLPESTWELHECLKDAKDIYI